jgi:hypothetical protein
MRRHGTLELILRVGILNAMLVTVISAIVMAVLAGSMSSIGPHLPNLVEVVKVVPLLCVVTAVPGGCGGLFGGMALGALMFAGRRKVGSIAGVLATLVIASFVFAVVFVLVMRWISGVPAPSLMLFGYFLAWLCAIPVSGLALRRRLLAARQSA